MTDESGVDTLDFSRLPQDAHGEIEFNTVNSNAFYIEPGVFTSHFVFFADGVIENVLGGAGPERVDAFDGVSHVLRLGPGNDDFFGGKNDGDDWFYGSGGHDYAATGRGEDRLFGASGNDVMRGHSGNDLLDGGPGADNLRGDGNSDTLRAADGEADDLIDCGVGIRDRVYYDASLDPEPVGCEVLNPR
jgi:Ca2+-binding RTX toxin-like protein